MCAIPEGSTAESIRLNLRAVKAEVFDLEKRDARIYSALRPLLRELTTWMESVERRLEQLEKTQ